MLSTKFNLSTEILLESIIHKYVNDDRSLKVDLVLQNWKPDSKEQLKWLFIIFSRIQGLKPESFDHLIKVLDKVNSFDINISKPVLAASLIYFSLSETTLDWISQQDVARSFNVSEAAIRNNRNKILDVLHRGVDVNETIKEENVNKV